MTDFLRCGRRDLRPRHIDLPVVGCAPSIMKPENPYGTVGGAHPTHVLNDNGRIKC